MGRDFCWPDAAFDRWVWEDYLRWTPDGSTILFSHGPALYGVTADGTRIWPVANGGTTFTLELVEDILLDRSGNEIRVTRPHHFDAGTTIPFDIAPDGERVVFATCRYRKHQPVSTQVASEASAPEFELAMVRVDGTRSHRLTANAMLDSHPAWSPDGRRIAYVHATSRVLRVTNVGGESLDLPIGDSIMQAPSWSPDGRELAVATDHGLILVAADGRYLRQLTTDVVGGPTWSPDGTRLAVVRPAGHEVALVTVAADGGDEKLLANFAGWENGDAKRAWVPTVAWSPDGSKILVVVQPGLERRPVTEIGRESGRAVYVVTASEPSPREARQIDLSDVNALNAAWAPDGSRLAVIGLSMAAATSWNASDLVELGPSVVLTMTPDGANQLVVAERQADGRLEAWNAPRPQDPSDLATCRAGHLIPDPLANPANLDLVDDCAALLALLGDLCGHRCPGDRNWSTTRPLSDWDGVALGGTALALRVRELRLADGHLRGQDARTLRWLTELRRLELSNFKLSYIPREFGQLRKLEEMQLAQSNLFGPIPAELAHLSELTYVDLSQNILSGSIPAALGRLSNLRFLNLGNNQLSGQIPAGLSHLQRLEVLWLKYNQLTGPIPAELSELGNLRDVGLGGNQFTGCVPAELPVVDRAQLGLPDCEAGA